MMPVKKIALFKKGSFSFVNPMVIEILRREFPNYDLDIFDIEQDFYAERSFENILHTLWWYGWDFLTAKRKIREEISQKSILNHTPFYFEQVRKRICERINSADYAFTFQTQSLFDASFPGVPHFVYTDHAHLTNLRYPEFQPAQLYSKTWVEAERQIYVNARMVFTTSKFLSESICQDYGLEDHKLACVYSGINVNVNVNLDLSQKQYNQKHILFVGIDWERKDGPLLVQAFEKLLDRHPNARLTIVGCKPEIDLPQVNIVGKVPQSELSQFYSAASIFCMPSKLEPSAVAIVEAAAYGLPVVSTNIGGTPDRVQPDVTGILITPGDLPALTTALDRLLSDPELCQRLGHSGQKLARERFRWERVGQHIKAQIVDALKAD
jgi:glycosyltransferase involved in cell wall biosynthesis